MNSNDNKISWFDSLGVINDKLTDIEINRNQNTAEMKLEFFNGLTWTEEFDLLDITPELVNFLFGNFNDTDIILEKENIKIKPSQMDLETGIKTVGIFKVNINLHAEIQVNILIQVEKLKDNKI